MCGICGLIGIELSEPIARQKVLAMKRVLVHRGPDDHGLYLAPSENGAVKVALGHQRLSIIDLTSGHQPMTNERGDIWIVYNGEIYNHVALRRDLEKRGHIYRTRSDTETIIHAYEEYGENCVHKLRGMFAFAIWDSRKRCVFAARDRLGIKPLYYALRNGQLIFASEIKAILASGLIPASVNHRALPEFFVFGQTVDDSTLFDGIRKLMPGHVLSFDGKDLDIRRYWDWRFEDQSTQTEERDYVDQFSALIEDSVKAHLMSDVPIGIFLSGGLDSSLIAAITARHASTTVETFTIGFDRQYYSEFEEARAVAAHIGAHHHETRLTAGQFMDAIPKLIWHEDEPLKGAPSVALYFISKLASERVKVVLTGEGSDELFAGYNDRYWATMLNRRLAQFGGRFIPDSVRKHIVRKFLWKLPLPLTLKKKISHTVLYLPTNVEGIFFDNFHSIFTREMQQELLDESRGENLSNIDPYANATALFKRSNASHFLHRMLYTDVNMDLAELLMKQDQMTMAASIESRVPFLDHLLVEFAGTVPPQLCLRGRPGKLLVKKAAEKFLPCEIVHRPKMGFPVPFGQWLREDSVKMVSEILLDKRTRDRGYFNVSYIEKLFKSHRSGQRDFQNQIWMLLNFELWHRVFIDDAQHAIASIISWVWLGAAVTLASQTDFVITLGASVL
jgi:asparagine synthase (glutamine-hydrolysing)